MSSRQSRQRMCRGRTRPGQGVGVWVGGGRRRLRRGRRGLRVLLQGALVDQRLHHGPLRTAKRHPATSTHTSLATHVSPLSILVDNCQGLGEQPPSVDLRFTTKHLHKLLLNSEKFWRMSLLGTSYDRSWILFFITVLLLSSKKLREWC